MSSPPQRGRARLGGPEAAAGRPRVAAEGARAAAEGAAEEEHPRRLSVSAPHRSPSVSRHAELRISMCQASSPGAGEADDFYDDGVVALEGAGAPPAPGDENEAHRALEAHHYQEKQYWLAHGSSVKAVPASVVTASRALAAITTGGAALDFVLEAFILAGLLPKLPLRVEYMVLVGLTALLGVHTLRGIRRCELDVTVDALQVGIVAELALIAGDAHFLLWTERTTYAAAIRSPFLVASAANILLMLYIASRLHLFPEFFHRRKAHKRRKRAARDWKAEQGKLRRRVKRAARRKARQKNAGAESSPNLAAMMARERAREEKKRKAAAAQRRPNSIAS